MTDTYPCDKCGGMFEQLYRYVENPYSTAPSVKAYCHKCKVKFDNGFVLY